MSNLFSLYRETVRKKLLEAYQYDSVMQVPRINKVVLNMRVKGANQTDKGAFDALMGQSEKTLALIAGQKPMKTLARKSVAGFGIRKGFALGYRVTLRKQRMWSFLDRLVHVALPRVRDFRGLDPRSGDGTGNYNLGVSESLIFPEIDVETAEKVKGFDICIVTTARKDLEALALLKGLGFPFKK